MMQLYTTNSADAIERLMRAVPFSLCPKCNKPGVVGKPYRVGSGGMVQTVLHREKPKGGTAIQSCCYVHIEQEGGAG